MTKLNELAKEYKQTKSKVVLEEIFKLITHKIKEKAKDMFYNQNFFKGQYKIRIYDKEKHKFINKIIIDTFKLNETKQVELEDVVQELYIEVLKLLENYDAKKPFENYFNYFLKKAKSKSIFNQGELIKNINTKSIYQTNNMGEEENLADKIPAIEPIQIEFSVPLTDKEHQIWELLIANQNLTQEEIAEELDISQKSVSNLISSIKNKIEK